MEDEEISWNELPVDNLIAIFSYLGLKDLCSASRVNRLWSEISSEDEFWKPIFKQIWVVHDNGDIGSGQEKFKELFALYMIKWKKYHHVYAPIKQAWISIESWLKMNCNLIYESLNKGATEEELDQLEKIVKAPLGDEFRCSYRIRNGQNIDENEKGALFGGYSFYDHLVDLYLLSIKDIIKKVSKKYTMSELWLSKHRSIPVLDSVYRSNKACYMCVETNKALSIFDQKNATTGTIVASSASTSNSYVFANSFTHLLTDHEYKLNEGIYDCYEGNISRFNSKSTYEATTRGVKIQVSPLFIPESSSDGTFTFAYQIRISMSNEMSKDDSCQLVTRRWAIKKRPSEPLEEVYGPGVIGLYPKVYPGSFFEYTSVCIIKSLEGSMEGSFQMRTINEELFDAIVPKFILKVNMNP